MIIKADKEGMDKIRNMCDICLRVGGMRNLDEINQILKSIEKIKEKEKND